MEKEENDGYVSIPADKAYKLQKLELLNELQSELAIWAKKRFWLITIVVGILSIVGINTSVFGIIFGF